MSSTAATINSRSTHANDLDARSLGEFQEEFRKLKKLELPDDETPSGFQRAKITVFSNYTTKYVVDALRLSMAQRKFWAVVSDAGYNQWESGARDPSASHYTSSPDFILFLLTSLGFAFDSRSSVSDIVKRISGAVISAKKYSAAKIFVTLPENLEEDLCHSSWSRDWGQQLRAGLRSELGAHCIFLDPNPILNHIGAKSWFSPRYFVTAKIPVHPNACPTFGAYIARAICQSIRQDCKLVIVDLDDTLWGGTIGDVSAEGLQLSWDQGGLAFLRLQRFLKGLRDRGVLLAIASKNDEQTALAGFSRPEMILKPSDFVARSINWQPKSASIRSILARLNLSTAGVWFLDNSAFERAEVQSAIPEIEIPELSEDALEWVPQLIATGAFDKAELTDTDAERNQFYETERLRQEESQETNDYQEFLQSLQLKIRTLDVDQNWSRFLELINKTNQFNMTTQRYDREQLQTLATTGARFFLFSAEDRLGDYGPVCAVIVRFETPAQAIIDTWVLSCRAMGRSIENGVLAVIVATLKASEVKRLRGVFIPTSKNKSSEDVYPRLGFEECSTSAPSCRLWELALDEWDAKQCNQHIEILSCPITAH